MVRIWPLAGLPPGGPPGIPPGPPGPPPGCGAPVCGGEGWRALATTAWASFMQKVGSASGRVARRIASDASVCRPSVNDCGPAANYGRTSVGGWGTRRVALMSEP
jgi:hypothetical protein